MSKIKNITAPRVSIYEYSTRGKIWKDSIPGGWYFLTISATLSKKIRRQFFSSEEGWGRLKVVAAIGSTEWNTAIWYDTKTVAYLLPVKALIRKKEALTDGSNVKVKLLFQCNDSLKT